MHIRQRRRYAAVALLGLLVLPWLWTACGVRPTPVQPMQVSGGDADLGKQALSSYGCGACHQVAGIANARGDVGPPLDGIARRRIIGGYLANDPANLIRWIQDPQGVAPGNAMPNMNVTDQDARNIAAYLYTLK